MRQSPLAKILLLRLIQMQHHFCFGRTTWRPEKKNKESWLSWTLTLTLHSPTQPHWTVLGSTCGPRKPSDITVTFEELCPIMLGQHGLSGSTRTHVVCAKSETKAGHNPTINGKNFLLESLRWHNLWPLYMVVVARNSFPMVQHAFVFQASWSEVSNHHRETSWNFSASYLFHSPDQLRWE